MAELLPSVGASGDWKVKAPFTNLYIAGTAYACKEIRKLSAVVAVGVDAYNEYYVAQGLTQAQYDADVANDISIVTLLSAAGNWLFIPSTYLDGWPSNDAVPYVVLGAVINLGPLPNTVDPSFLTPKIQNLIKDALGHDVDVEYVALSDVTNKTFADHTALEQARQNNITDSNTDTTRRIQAENDLASARSEIAALQQVIIDAGIVLPQG